MLLPIRDEAVLSLSQQGYAFISGAYIPIREDLRMAWKQLKSAWEDLPIDEYMPDHGQYRRRRYGRWAYSEATRELITRPTKAYYQDPRLNHFAGGIPRCFPPLSADFINNPFLRLLLRQDVETIACALSQRPPCWEVDTHMVRIIATEETPGLPAPEGVHRDGLDFIATHLIQRHNISGGGAALSMTKLVSN